MGSRSGDGGEDYYAVLNVERDASPDQLKTAYRQLCIVYHPDKYTNEQAQRDAAAVFPKIQRAYAVLSDPKQRAMYDLHGVQGLAAGSELLAYTGSANELKAQYELLEKKRNLEREQAMANPKGKMSVQIDATGLFDTSLEDLEYDDEDDITLVEIRQMALHQSIETELSDDDKLVLSGSLVSNQGRGGGNVAMQLKHNHSPTLQSECKVAVGTGNYISGKITKTIEHGCYILAETMLHQVYTPYGVAYLPGASLGLYRSLTNRTSMFVRWDGQMGSGTAVNTTMYYEGENSYLSTSFQVGSEDSAVSVNFHRKITEKTKMKLSGSLGLSGITVGYGGERQLGEQSKLSMSLFLNSMDGVSLRIKFTRMQQVYLFPISLSHDVGLESTLYGTIFPAAVYFLFRKFVVLPWAAKAEREKLKQARRRHAATVAEQKKDAMTAIRLMQETVGRKIAAEERVGGLIIVEALYGQLVSTGDADDDLVTNVTIPLQCLVQDSRLILASGSKAGLVGFYDPCIDEAKQLSIKYKFNGQLHKVVVEDTEEVRIPKRGHLIA